MYNLIYDHDTKDIVAMLLEKLGYQSLIKYVEDKNVDSFIRFIKTRANLKNELKSEINFYL